jgi:hypothetical protein
VVGGEYPSLRKATYARGASLFFRVLFTQGIFPTSKALFASFDEQQAIQTEREHAAAEKQNKSS